MATAAYKTNAEKLKLPDLLEHADLIREAIEHPGFKFLQAEIDAHTARLTARLVHQSTKPEQVEYLRGQIEALGAVREAPAAILALAEERETAAKQSREQESYV